MTQEDDQQRTQQCPLTLVTASTDRRTGNYIKTVFEGYRQRAASEASSGPNHGAAGAP